MPGDWGLGLQGRAVAHGTSWDLGHVPQWIGLRENLQETIDFSHQRGFLHMFSETNPLKQTIGMGFTIKAVYDWNKLDN